MLVKNQKVKTKWNSYTKAYYESLGYVYTKMNDIFEVELKDLPYSSHTKINVICDYCGEEFKKRYKDYIKQHINGDCCEKCRGKKSLLCCEKKNGKGFRGKKLKEITIERYNVDNAAKSKKIMDKIQETNLQKYGYKTALLIPENREKVIQLIKSEEVLNKRKNTNLQKYGNISPLGNSEIRKKIVNSYYKNGSVKTSKQQYSLYEMLKKEFENCYLNYPFDRYSLDCYVCIDNIKIDIEYDGNFWHKEKERDLKRDNFLISNNIKVLRIKANYKVPTLEQLKEKMQILIETDCYYSEIVLEN